MIARSQGVGLEELAHRSFQFFTHLSLSLPLARRRNPGELKELEFLTLAILRQAHPMIVGDIQRILGVLPAQMSRIIRSLEGRKPPLIACQINPQDKRKVDVCLTASGEKALMEYEATRTDRLVQLLRDLPEQEQEDLNRLVDKLHGLVERTVAN